VAVVIFFILGICVNAGANNTYTYSSFTFSLRPVVMTDAARCSVGAVNWTIGEAPFVNGFAGFATLFVKAAYAYSGTEAVLYAAAEVKNPTFVPLLPSLVAIDTDFSSHSRNIKRIANRVFFRIIIFYVTTVVLVGSSLAVIRKERAGV
jgi:AAT family amino acid transporter